MDRPHTTSVIKVTESEQYRSKHNSPLVAIGPAKYSGPYQTPPGNKYIFIIILLLIESTESKPFPPHSIPDQPQYATPTGIYQSVCTVYLHVY